MINSNNCVINYYCFIRFHVVILFFFEWPCFLSIYDVIIEETKSDKRKSREVVITGSQ